VVCSDGRNLQAFRGAANQSQARPRCENQSLVFMTEQNGHFTALKSLFI